MKAYTLVIFMLSLLWFMGEEKQEKTKDNEYDRKV